MQPSSAALRVLHIVHMLGDGGAARALTRVVSHANPAEIAHTILALAPGPGHLALPRHVRLLTLEHGGGLQAALDLLFSSGLPQADVVHGWVSYPSVVAAAYSAATGCALVLRQPTNIEEELRWSGDGLRGYWRELRAAFALADCVILPSPVLEAGTRRVYGVGR